MTRSSLIYQLIIFVIILFLVACANKPKGGLPLAMQQDLQVDTSLIAVIPYTGEWIPGKTNTPATLTMDDMKRIEFLLTSCVTRNDKTIDLKGEKYKRQYIAVTNEKGDKIVWVNCLCRVDDSNWKTSIAVVHDGGSCYFNLMINLTKSMYYDFWVNGYARAEY